MPRPVEERRRYMPGLDGLRAIAVLAVIAYHLGFPWAEGGLLGVGVFFTLSGYLITDILLNQVRRGGIRLKAFWLARARRLLPALFVVLIVVLAWVTLIGPHQAPAFRMETISSAFYFNNWWLIIHNASYFERFKQSPLDHIWSLSIEEQFYILWPFLLMLGTRFIREPAGSGGVRLRLAGATVLAAIGSLILMAVLYQPSIDPSRVYYGTDTRAFELLAGAALAMVWPSRRLRTDIAPRARNLVDGAGALGLVVIGVMFWRVGEFSPFLYRGGFALLSMATVLAVAALTHPAARIGEVVGCRPMRWIGERSYGIYLWHMPIIVLTTPEGLHAVEPLRAAIQVAATFAIADLSWRFIENPIRHGALGRLYRQVRAGRLRRESVTPQGWALASAAAIVFAVAVAGLAGLGTSAESAIGSARVQETVTAKRAANGPLATSCSAVVHIGDSTSEGLVDPEYNPPSKLIAAQYARVGATTAHLDVSGARSIYENFEGLPNAQEAAEGWKNQGFKGCWVIAMGTNEAANVAAGSSFGYDDRIRSMMETIGEEPVLWVNTKTLETTGPYAESNMRDWDRALREACDYYPYMRVYDWASAVHDDWYIPDGIHFTSHGYAERGRLIADALLKAFPNTHPLVMKDADNCLITTP
ncbi:MAG TPA: acyltransferase family protein [Solirubrobacterales bacterium]|nr:acyltransferase family protein [Solirubrobacterales bacterium]